MSLEIELYVHGLDVEAFSDLARKLWESPTIKVSRDLDPKTITKDGSPILGYVRIILAVPAAIKATLDLAERAKLSEKIRSMINWAKKGKEENELQNITIKLPDGRMIFLPEVDPAQVITMQPSGRREKEGNE